VINSLYSKLLSALRVFFGPRDTRISWIDFGVFALWIVIVCAQIANHAMWRDEVRALTIALSGDSLFAMLRVLHGEGHPALWYLLLREAHAVFGVVAVLPGVAFAIAAATAALLAFCSPFPRGLVILLLGTHCFLYEYSVMARNYGISAFILFIIAMSYRRWRDHGIVLGVLLFLLANTNIVATMMVMAFLLFWLLDLIEESGIRWTSQFNVFLLNAAIAIFGAVLCALTILPTFNDAAAVDWSKSSPTFAALKALMDPGATTLGSILGDKFPGIIGSILLFGATAGLLPKRAAFLAALAGLLLESLFATLGAQGGLRHALVWLNFCVALYWICWLDVTTAVPDTSKPSSRELLFYTGRLTFLLILGAQFVTGLQDIKHALFGGFLESRSADLGRLIAGRADLANAIVVSEPDFMVEALPYYAPNRTYFVRQQGFGRFVRFSRSGKLDTNLGEILSVSRQLQQETRLPIVIVMSDRLKDITPDRTYAEGYNWTFSASEAQIRDFLSATTLISQFGPAESGETYDVYMLREEDRRDKPSSGT
jgi:hypothetical protein